MVKEGSPQKITCIMMSAVIPFYHATRLGSLMLCPYCAINIPYNKQHCASNFGSLRNENDLCDVAPWKFDRHWLDMYIVDVIHVPHLICTKASAVGRQIWVGWWRPTEEPFKKDIDPRSFKLDLLVRPGERARRWWNIYLMPVPPHAPGLLLLT